MLHLTDMAIFIIQDVHDVLKIGELRPHALLLTPKCRRRHLIDAAAAEKKLISAPPVKITRLAATERMMSAQGSMC